MGQRGKNSSESALYSSAPAPCRRPAGTQAPTFPQHPYGLFDSAAATQQSEGNEQQEANAGTNVGRTTKHAQGRIS